MKEHEVLVSEEIGDVCREVFLKTRKEGRSWWFEFNDVTIIMIPEKFERKKAE